MAVAFVGGTLAAWFLWSFYRTDLNWYTAVPLAIAPTALMAGAMRAGDRPWSRPPLRSRGYAALLAYVIVTALIGLANPPPPDQMSKHVPASVEKATLAALGNVASLESSGLWMGIHERGAVHSVEVEGERVDYASVQVEVWAARSDGNGVDVTRAAPLATAPLQYGEYSDVGFFSAQLFGVWLYGPGETLVGYHGHVSHALYRDWGSTYFVLVGEKDDGSRDILDYRDTWPMFFTGSVLEWLLAR